MKVLRDKYCPIAKTSARRTLRLRLRENPSIRKSLLELVFSLFSRQESIRHARLWRENSFFPPALRFVRNSRSAQGNAWQKCDFAALYQTFWVQRHAAALALPAKIHTFRLRYAPRRTVVPLKVTLGKSAILPRFIELYSMRRRQP